MLKTLRKPSNVKRIMWAVVILIIPAFILFYGWSTLTGSKDSTPTFAAKVNGKEISIATFQREYQRYFEEAKRLSGDKFNEEAAQELNLAGSVLDELESRELVMTEAKKLGIDVSNQELIYVIQAQSGFQTAGKFDKRKYYQYLANERLSPEQFESQLKTDRIYQKTRALVTDFVKISEPESREEFRKQYEKMNIDFVRFATQDYLKDINVDDKEAETFYKAHERDFQIPPQYNLVYASISPTLFEKSIQISDKDIKDYYNGEISSFVLPEQARVRHIVVKISQNPTTQEDQAANQKMKAILDRLNKGESFEKVAKEVSEDPETAKIGGDLGWIKMGDKDQDPTFEKMIFSLEPGKISQVIRTSMGFHVLKVDQKQVSRNQTLDEVKDTIVKTLKSQAEDSAMQAQLDNLFRDITPQAKLSDLADKYSMSKGTTGWFSGSNVPGFIDNKEVSSLISALTPGKISEPVKVSASYTLFQLIGKQESRIPKFEEIKPKVKATLLFQKAQEFAKSKAADAAKLSKAGSSLEDIASKTGQKISSMGPFSAEADIPGLGQNSPLAIRAFYLPEGKVSDVITMESPQQKGFVEYFIIRVKSRIGGNETEYLDNKDTITEKVLSKKRQQAFQEWIDTLKKRAKIQTNQTLLATYQKNQGK